MQAAKWLDNFEFVQYFREVSFFGSPQNCKKSSFQEMTVWYLFTDHFFKFGRGHGHGHDHSYAHGPKTTPFLCGKKNLHESAPVCPSELIPVRTNKHKQCKQVQAGESKCKQVQATARKGKQSTSKNKSKCKQLQARASKRKQVQAIKWLNNFELVQSWFAMYGFVIVMVCDVRYCEKAWFCM